MIVTMMTIVKQPVHHVYGTVSGLRPSDVACSGFSLKLNPVGCIESRLSPYEPPSIMKRACKIALYSGMACT